MDILVISDTHGRQDRLLEVAERSRAGAVLFLGDGLRDLDALPDDVTVRAVRGNCDFFGRDVPDTRVEIFGTCRIFMTHGHRYGVKSSLDAAVQAALAAHADVLLYGHTHLPLERTLSEGTQIGDRLLEKPLLIFNPGSLGEPRDGIPSFGTLTLRKDVILSAHGKL